MTLLALSLVIIAAFLHASWNLASKQASDAGTSFIFVFRLCSVIIYLPWVIYILVSQSMVWQWQTAGILVLSSVLHLAYTVLLLKGYQAADLSIVYPVARGSAPVFASIAAVIWLNEHMHVSQAIGIACVAGGILLMATRGDWRQFAQPAAWTGIRWGLIISLFIATYSIVDAYAVKTMLIMPVVLDWVSSLGGAVLLGPNVWANRRGFRHRMQGKWLLAMWVGLASPLAYILVLYALRLGANVSQVAPLREMSMVMATFIGAIWLKEQVGFTRWLGCVVIVTGVVLISLS